MDRYSAPIQALRAIIFQSYCGIRSENTLSYFCHNRVSRAHQDFGRRGLRQLGPELNSQDSANEFMLQHLNKQSWFQLYED